MFCTMSETKLKKQIVSGMVWKFAERFVAQGVSFIVSLVLARILMPEDYGAVAIINVFIVIADVFLTSGLNTALIQAKDVDETDFSTIFWCNFGLGLLLYMVLFIAAPFIAQIYSIPILTAAIRVFALRLPVSAFQSIQIAYVSRRMEFKKFFFATITGTLVSAIVGIAMALNGFGVWALIAQYMTNTIIDTLFLFTLVRWIPRFVFSIDAARPLIKYGSKVLLTDLIGILCNNLGDFIIGIKYTSAHLAYYTKGKQLPSLLKQNIYTSLISVLFPGMSKVGDQNEKVKQISRKSIQMLTYILYPMMIGMIVVAEPLTLALYTEKWIAMVPFVRIVCLEVLLSVPGTIALQSLKSIGRSDLMLKAEFARKPILLISIIIALRFGVMAIALALPLNAFIDIIINSYLTKKTIKYSLFEQIKDCSAALFMSSIMGLVVYCIGLINLNIFLLLVLQVITGGVIYIVLSVWTKNTSFDAIKELLLSKSGL